MKLLKTLLVWFIIIPSFYIEIRGNSKILNWFLILLFKWTLSVREKNNSVEEIYNMSIFYPRFLMTSLIFQTHFLQLINPVSLNLLSLWFLLSLLYSQDEYYLWIIKIHIIFICQTHSISTDMSCLDADWSCEGTVMFSVCIWNPWLLLITDLWAVIQKISNMKRILLCW